MAKRFHGPWYWIALILTVAFFLLCVAEGLLLFLVARFSTARINQATDGRFHMEPMIWGAAFFSTGALVIFACMVFGWRRDRRDGRHLELRVRELELKLQEADQKNHSDASDHL